jgi:Kelch motif
MGAMIGDDFVIVSGFAKSWLNTTKKVYSFNTKNSTAMWMEQDEVPVPIGFSHSAFAVNGNTLYICGGYVGPTPGPDTNACLKYSHKKPRATQWEHLPSLPEGRGGGGLWYMNYTNSLQYTTGATRPNGTATDHNTTWELSLNNMTKGWMRRADLPYRGNHVSHVTVHYNGTYRHFVAGGQERQNENYANRPDHYEYDNMKKTWIQRASMPYGRGHASASTFAYGCGYIMAGGAINNKSHTADISYYGIDTNTWTSIGNLTMALNTPVCDIVRFANGTDYIYCQTGPISAEFSWRRQISFL